MLNQRISFKVFMAIGITIILWASAFVGIRAALPYFQPVQLAAFRYLVASVILIPIAFHYKIKPPKSQDILAIIFTGFFGFTLYNMVLNFGEKSVTAASACFIVNGGNLVTAIFLKEKITKTAWAGIIVSMVGVGFISGGESNSFITFNSGALLILVAALSQSAYFIFQKSLLSRYSAFELLCFSIWIGTVLLLPFSSGLSHSILTSSLPSILSVVYLGVFPAVIAYFCWSYVLSKLDASKAAVYLFLVPLVTLLIGFLWLGEIPSCLAILGGSIVILGIIIAKYGFTIFKHD